MSDSNSNVPGTVMGDGEPSMEDILASIRKVIADDNENTHSESAALRNNPDADGTAQDESADDILDLVTFVDKHTDAADTKIDSQAQDNSPKSAVEAQTTPTAADVEPAPLQHGESQDNTNQAFDETLDLVMDSDASDYMTTRLTPQTPVAPAASEAIPKDLGVTEALEAEPIQAEPSKADLDSAAAKIDTETVDLDVTSSSVSLDPDSIEIEVTSAHVSVERDSLSSTEEDMDLVKSLLSDLMMDSDSTSEADELADLELDLDADEPEAILAQDGVSQENENQDSELENLVTQTDIPVARAGDLVDEDAQNAQNSELTVDEEADDDVDKIDSVLDRLLDENLAQEVSAQVEAEASAFGVAGAAMAPTGEANLVEIAKHAAQNTNVEPVSAVNPDDEVVLEIQDLKSRLALLTGLGTAAAIGQTGPKSETEAETVAQSETGSAPTPTPDSVDAAQTLDANVQPPFSEVTAPEPTSSEQSALEQTDVENDIDTRPDSTSNTNSGDVGAGLETSSEAEIQTQSELKEGVAMATQPNKPTLVDEETERETGEVFASLSVAVKEQTKLEESGPPIGDLVQEALRPMLQDWLDKNLKGIVERAVKAEVKRIASQK